MENQLDRTVILGLLIRGLNIIKKTGAGVCYFHIHCGNETSWQVEPENAIVVSFTAQAASFPDSTPIPKLCFKLPRSISQSALMLKTKYTHMTI